MADLKNILEIIDQAQGKFESKIPDIEKKIFRDVSLLLKDLKVTSAGNIQQTVENLRLINEIKSKLGKIVVSKEYANAVNKFVSNIPEISNFQKLTEGIPLETRKMMTETAKAQIDHTLENLIGSGYKQAVVSNLYNTLLTSVTTGGSYADLTEQLRNQLITTEESPGMLSKYSKTFVTDTLGQFAGQGNSMIADALNSEWFQYVGSNLTTTREFCEHLTKKRYVHKSEIPTLLKGIIDGHECKINEATGLPRGMKEETTPENFIVLRGGWNCGHELIPVSEVTVPKNIRDKFNSEPSEIQLLNIDAEKLKEFADEYGVGTAMIDKALQSNDITQIRNAISIVKTTVNAVKGQYDSLLGKVHSALNEAKAANVDASELEALESQLIISKADYRAIKQSITDATNSLRTNVARKIAQQYAINSSNSQKTKERIVNDKEIEVKLNVTQGKEMTFEEANKGYGNKNYSQGGGYTVNCQSCVVANELRRRGFDVTAQENTEKSGNIPYELSKKTSDAWIDPTTGKTPNKQKAGGAYDVDKRGNIKSKNIKELSKELADLTKDVGRYHIDFDWKNGSSGHIITLERLSNGKIRLYDPQTGKEIQWIELSKKIKLRTGVYVLRVDNLLVNTKIVDGIVIKT